MGDGILACFGYPRSHEDDASRACRVGLQIIGSMQQALPTLKVRIAAATGLVVSSDMFVIGAVEQHSIIGSTPNLAARLQERAPPGGMLIADETRLLVGEGFELRRFRIARSQGRQPSGAGVASRRRTAGRESLCRPFLGRETIACSAGGRNLMCCLNAGARRAPAAGSWSWFMASRESASRACCMSCATGSHASPPQLCSSNAPRIRPAARCTQ